MKVNYRVSKLAILAITTLIFANCQYKDLEEPIKTPFKLDFNHGRVDSIPQSYRVAFYPADEETREYITKGYMLFDVPYTASVVELPAGKYIVTAFNNDTEHVITDGYSSQTDLFAKTPKARPQGITGTPVIIDSLYGGQTLVDYPDYMTHTVAETFILRDGEEEQVLTLTPDSMVVTVEIRAGGVKGLNHVKEIRGSVNNVAGTRLIAQDNITKDTTAVIFACRANANENSIMAKFYVFGIETTGNRQLDHTLVFYFWMEHGTKVYIPVDITELLKNVPPEQKYVCLDIANIGVDLEKYDTGANAFNTEVEEWQDEHVELNF